MAPPRSPQSARDHQSIISISDDERSRSPSLELLTLSPSPKLEPINALCVPTISSYAAPTPVIKRSDIVLDAPGTFHLFPFFPTEIRHKIWNANIRPQVVQILYDVNYETERRNSYMHGHQYRAGWRFTAPQKNNVPNRTICQESRREATKAGYEVIRLSDDPTKARWFNPDFDTLFLDTNADVDYPFDDADYDEQESDSALPPVGKPLFAGGMSTIKYLAVNDHLWTEWPFSEDNGSDASCEYCPGFHWDDSKEDFKDIIAAMPALERLQIMRSVTLVLSDDGTVGVELKKRGSEDHYGMCLLRRLNDWKEEKALNIDVEVV